MKRPSVWLCAALLLMSFVFSPNPMPVQAETRFAAIGTGAVTGVYYPTGLAIAKIVNEKRRTYGLRCTVESTGGSVFNVNAVMSGDLEFGVVQSDRQYQAVHGTAEWTDMGPQKGLRAVFTIHSESHVLCASENSGVGTVPDLKGKAVGVGNPGSGQRGNFIDMLSEYGMTYDDLGRAEGLKASESSKLLQDGRIDAFVYTVGHPSAFFKEATAGRIKVRFIPFDRDKIAALIKRHPYYVPAEIPMEYYPGALNKERFVPTFAVKATLVTRDDVPEDMVYAVTKEVFEHFEDFKKLHPAYEHLTKEGMLQGMTAPIHPGALKYYREAGLME